MFYVLKENMEVLSQKFAEISVKIERSSTQLKVDGIHFIGSCPLRPVGSHIIIRLSQSKSEVSHVLNACNHGYQWCLPVRFDSSKFQSLMTNYSSLRVKQHESMYSNCKKCSTERIYIVKTPLKSSNTEISSMQVTNVSLKFHAQSFSVIKVLKSDFEYLLYFCLKNSYILRQDTTTCKAIAVREIKLQMH